MRRADISRAATCLTALCATTGCYSDDILATRIGAAAAGTPSCGAGVRIETPLSACPALPMPTGPVVCVTPDQTAALTEIVAAAAPGSTIVLAAGVYGGRDGEPAPTLSFDVPGMTLRSASGVAADVILDGQYASETLVAIHASDVTIAGITLRRALHHAIHITPAADASIEGVVLRGLHIVDSGNRSVKVDAAATSYVDRGTLDCSTLELTAEGRQHIQPTDTECDTGGVLASQTRDWAVRNNAFRGFYCPAGGVASHAVHFADGSRDSLVEQNSIVECARGIGLGSQGTDPLRRYDDDPYPGIAPIAHYGGIVRNNVIAATVSQFDTGVELMQARGARVLHNSIFHPETAFSSIDYRFANTAVVIGNNLVVRMTSRDQARAEVFGNLVDATSALFVDAGQGDLHLVPSATVAIDQAVPFADAGSDIDGFVHDVGPPDIGADELGAP